MSHTFGAYAGRIHLGQKGIVFGVKSYLQVITTVIESATDAVIVWENR
jgi:hypothetical protein